VTHFRHLCMRCGVPSVGKVCMDCRETDPQWFALTGLYHPKSNKTGQSVSPERKPA
jgi:hypothetical protein